MGMDALGVVSSAAHLLLLRIYNLRRTILKHACTSEHFKLWKRLEPVFTFWHWFRCLICHLLWIWTPDRVASCYQGTLWRKAVQLNVLSTPLILLIVAAACRPYRTSTRCPEWLRKRFDWTNLFHFWLLAYSEGSHLSLTYFGRGCLARCRTKLGRKIVCLGVYAWVVSYTVVVMIRGTSCETVWTWHRHQRRGCYVVMLLLQRPWKWTHTRLLSPSTLWSKMALTQHLNKTLFN